MKNANTKETDDLPVTPGYSLREGRSGYDPIDTQAEVGHVAGLYLRKLITGQLRAKKPLHYVLMTLIGLLLVFPLISAMVLITRGTLFDWDALLTLGLMALVGALFLLNCVRSALNRTAS
ncbi:MAG: hypothetical protein WCL57_03990 [Chloroflexota bacterium]|jgi:hypothetical protein